MLIIVKNDDRHRPGTLCRVVEEKNKSVVVDVVNRPRGLYVGANIRGAHNPGELGAVYKQHILYADVTQEQYDQYVAALATREERLADAKRRIEAECEAEVRRIFLLDD